MASQVILSMVFCGFLGTLGQVFRTIVGLKKMRDNQISSVLIQPFDWNILGLSILIGFAAGILGYLTLDNEQTDHMGKQTIVTLMSMGYAGADFVEGVLVRKKTRRILMAGRNE